MMAEVSNPFTIYLYDVRSTTLPLFAKKNNLNASSLRNTVYGKKPIIRVVKKLAEVDKELYNLLPQVSKDLYPLAEKTD
jgi:hypothetical protein